MEQTEKPHENHKKIVFVYIKNRIKIKKGVKRNKNSIKSVNIVDEQRRG